MLPVGFALLCLWPECFLICLDDSSMWGIGVPEGSEGMGDEKKWETQCGTIGKDLRVCVLKNRLL